MNWERAKITATTTAVRARAKLRLLVQLVGLVAIALGAWNMLVVPSAGVEPLWTGYRAVAGVAAVGDQAIVAIADVGLMAAGAVVAWLL
jgi:hypothetical protein